MLAIAPVRTDIFTIRQGEGGRQTLNRMGAPFPVMRHTRRWIDVEDDQAGANRQTASLAGLAAMLLLVVVCLVLVRELRHQSSIEDCLLSGRSTCAETTTLP